MQTSACRSSALCYSTRLLVLGILIAVAAFQLNLALAFGQSGPSALRGNFDIGKSGRIILLPVHFVDREISCLLDTGASRSAFDVKLRRLLGEPRTDALIEAPGAIARVESFDWPLVRLGQQTIKSSKPVISAELEGMRQACNQPVYGIIGIDVLRQSRLQIDFNRGVLKFLDQLPETADQLGVRIPIQFADDGTARLTGSISGEREESFLIDTGAQGNSLAVGVFDELADQNRIRLVSKFASATIVGDAHGSRGKLDALKVGPFTHKDLRFARVRMNSLGLRYWSRFRITIDFPGSCLYLEPGALFNKPEPLATSGMMLKWIDGRIQVENVREHSTAKRAGVEPGDVLLEIDGHPTTEYDPFSLRELLTSQAGRVVPMIVRSGERRFACELVLDKD